ncbi:dUTP diphosphatase [Candidatus Pacearchaeota archaeon]|nr:dUTP diphosphatase [Candidatus Pacearchaeota archaeon]
MKLKVKKLDNEATLPNYAHPGDAGMDLYSSKDYPPLNPGERCLIHTGISLEIPEGYELQIRPKSGLALKHGLSIVNTPGTIDSGYRGEVGIILINHGEKPYTVKKGEKVAQGVFSRFESAELEEVVDLSDTSRGAGGFGSTGK